MSFRQRLALFFVLLVVVPTAALLLILFLVSEDARRGKADARIAAGLETAIALHDDRVAQGRQAAERLADEPGLGAAIRAGDRSRLVAIARAVAAEPGVAAIQLFDAGGARLAAAGTGDAIAFGEVGILDGDRRIGSARASATRAQGYVDRVKSLTSRELVVNRDGEPLAFTVTAPGRVPQPAESVDLRLAGVEYRARSELLDSTAGESILLLGPRKEGSVLAFGRPAVALLTAFLILAGAFAWTLARTLSDLHERTQALAATDPLTGLWNRRRMHELLEREAERSRRFGRRFSLLILDLDSFKSINDRFGHPQGDRLLEEVSRVLERETRTIDEAIRYGGDELAVILPETDAHGAAVLAERLRARIEAADLAAPGGESMRTTVSIGIATVPEDGDDVEALVRAADDALLEAKRGGKNRIAVAPADGAALAAG